MEPTEIQVPQPEETQQTEKRAKPPLTVEQQLVHLKAKGVTFDLCNEEEAATYLSDKCQFFRVIAYRKLFDKHVGGERDGQYINLDFAQLRYLAGLDRQFRDVMLAMFLDIEHFAKARLLHELTLHADEDGYSVVADYREELKSSGRMYMENELRARKGDDYCGDIIQKYAGGMPLWALLEVVSFGTLIGMMKFCADRWGDPDLKELHYQLKRVKFIRNATGHSSCFLNDIGDKKRGSIRVPSVISRELSQMGLPKKLRARKLRNARMQQVVSLLYLYSVLVRWRIPHSSARRTPQILRNRRREHGCPACHPPRPVLRYLHGAFDKRIQTARLVSHSKTIWFYGAGLRKRFCPGFFSPDRTPAFKGSGFSACDVFTGCCRQTHRTLQSKSPWRSTECPARALNEAAFDRTNGSTAPAHGAARPDRAALP